LYSIDEVILKMCYAFLVCSVKFVTNVLCYTNFKYIFVFFYNLIRINIKQSIKMKMCKNELNQQGVFFIFFCIFLFILEIKRET